MNELNQVVASVDGVSLSLGEWLADLQRRALLPALVRQVVIDRLLARRAAEAGLAATDAELRAAAEATRRRKGLTSAAATNAWLGRMGWTVEDFEHTLEQELVTAKLSDHVTRDQIPGHFASQRDRFARARLRQIVVPNGGIARKLLAQLREEGKDFAELARAHSVDAPSRRTGGSLGVVTRYALPPSLAEAVFAARPGTVVGPVAGNDGFRLVLVEELLPAQLNADTAAVIRAELFRAWLAQQLQSLQLDLSGLGETCSA
jgi:parvulin-like peptidyl-prolyl isomerase